MSVLWNDTTKVQWLLVFGGKYSFTRTKVADGSGGITWRSWSAYETSFYSGSVYPVPQSQMFFTGLVIPASTSLFKGRVGFSWLAAGIVLVTFLKRRVILGSSPLRRVASGEKGFPPSSHPVSSMDLYKTRFVS